MDMIIQKTYNDLSKIDLKELNFEELNSIFESLQAQYFNLLASILELEKREQALMLIAELNEATIALLGGYNDIQNQYLMNIKIKIRLIQKILEQISKKL